MRSRALPVLFGGIIALWALAFLNGAAGPVTAFDGPFWNGPYQHFNALRRIQAGQTGGIDFQFFHGLGVPYLHYPLFRLVGDDIHASEAARYLVNLAAYVLPYPIVLFAATRRLTAALGLSAAALLLSELLGLHFLATPSHNTPGVRAAAPYLLLAVLFAGFRPRIEAIVSGVLTGVAFLLGTEHGIAAAAMLAATWAGRRWTGHPSSRATWLALAFGCALATAATLLVAIGGLSGAAKAMRYAFIDVPADQFWYFGTPNLPYLGSWSEVAADQRMLLAFGAALTQAAILLIWARQSETGRRLGLPLVGGLVYGMLASVGYLSYTGYQFHLPLIRVELTVALLIAWRAADALWTADPARYAPAMTALQFGFAAAVLIAGPLHSYGSSSVFRVPSMVRSVWAAGRSIARGECRLSDRTASHLDQLVRTVDANRSRSGSPTLWSEYAGLLESHYGVFHPSHDYIIHARGPHGSDEYLAAFRAADPEFAFTFHREYWPHLEKQQAADWGFYEELFSNYEPITRTWVGHLWKRTPGPWQPAPDTGWTDVTPEQPDAFALPPLPPSASGDTVVVVEVNYAVHRSAAGRIPILGQTPRHLLFPSIVAASTRFRPGPTPNA